MNTAEAEGRLYRANREYQSKHLTLRKKMLTVVGTLGKQEITCHVLCSPD